MNYLRKYHISWNATAYIVVGSFVFLQMPVSEAEKKLSNGGENPISSAEDPFSLFFFPRAGLRNAGESLSGRGVSRHASTPRTVADKSYGGSSKAVAFRRLEKPRETLLAPLRAFKEHPEIFVSLTQGKEHRRVLRSLNLRAAKVTLKMDRITLRERWADLISS